MDTSSIYKKIRERNDAREDAQLSEFACPSDAATRRIPEPEIEPDWENIRAPFFRDTDRVIHSLAYSRYIDKTQVFYLFDNDHITHRVLHVQFVSKIARTLARSLRLNEDLVEAIALGHDIGHVPFGHDGEAMLDDICRERGIGAFCHNAQSVRWVMELENRGRGLNLTLQTLDGMLSHNGEILTSHLEPERGKTWEQLLDEYRHCLRDAAFSRTLRPMTLEGCVMRFSDIIAYIGRDIEDAIKLGLLTRDDLPADAVAVLGDTNSQIINTLVLDLIEHSYGKDRIEFSRPVYDALRTLMRFNSERIYRNTRCHVPPDKLRRLFRTIYDDCLAQLQAAEDAAGHAAPGESENPVRDDRQENERVRPARSRPDVVRFARACGKPWLSGEPPALNARVAVDFIAGMTDEFFLAEARRLLLPAAFGRKASRA